MIRGSEDNKQMKKELTNISYWNEYWRVENRQEVNFYFSDLLDDFISWNGITNYMEIGGAPGTIMTYLYYKHGLTVSTVDFTDRDITEKFLNDHKVENYEIIQEDFNEFDPDSFGKKYDIVSSWGFVEHFSKDTCILFIEKHKKLVEKEGYLIIELPNIRKMFWLMYYVFNRKLIKIHNLEIMDLEFLKAQILAGDDFEILYSGYYATINEQNEFFIKHTRLRDLCKGLIEQFKNHKVKDSVKKWIFPYIVLIAKKKT